MGHTFSSTDGFRETVRTRHMATIELLPDNVSQRIWWMNWVENNEIIGRIVQDSGGRCEIAPSGPHWSPVLPPSPSTIPTRRLPRYNFISAIADGRIGLNSDVGGPASDRERRSPSRSV